MAGNVWMLKLQLRSSAHDHRGARCNQKKGCKEIMVKEGVSSCRWRVSSSRPIACGVGLYLLDEGLAQSCLP